LYAFLFFHLSHENLKGADHFAKVRHKTHTAAHTHTARGLHTHFRAGAAFAVGPHSVNDHRQGRKRRDAAVAGGALPS